MSLRTLYGKKQSNASVKGHKARKYGSSGSKSTVASNKVARVMGEFKRGSLNSGSPKGPKVTSSRQAIAIAMSEARKASRVVLILVGLCLPGCGKKVVKAEGMNLVPAFAKAHPELDAKTEVYEVRKGDTLWDISYKQTGSSFLWPLLWKANRDFVVDPDWIEIGDALDIPSGWPEADLDWAVRLAGERDSKAASPSFQRSK
jgi:nucleoid-associated protein YgaU